MFFVYYQGNWSAGGLLGKRQLSARDSNYHKNILVEERELMRMERKLKKIGPQGGRGWRTIGTTEDNVVMNDYSHIVNI